MPQKWWVLAAVACGTFMATLDSSIVNIALPTLTKELGADLYQVKWVVIAYLLVITCLLLPFGRLSDQYGRKRIFQLGFFDFHARLRALRVAPTLALADRRARASGRRRFDAHGQRPGDHHRSFPANERGNALGTLAMVVSAGLISGPSIGGILITELGWRSIFLVNLLRSAFSARCSSIVLCRMNRSSLRIAALRLGRRVSSDGRAAPFHRDRGSATRIDFRWPAVRNSSHFSGRPNRSLCRGLCKTRCWQHR